MSLAEFLACEPSLVNALYAAICENAGMQPRATYRNKDILAHAEELMEQAGDTAYLH